MALDPIKFTFGLSDFPGYLNIPKDKLHKTISSFFSDYFKDIGGETTVDIDNNYIIVQWLPNSVSDIENAIQSAVNFLSQGKLSQGEAMLASLYNRLPENQVVLYNYGMILSDKGKLDEALLMLTRLTELAPENSRGWNALSVAYARTGNNPEALTALKKSFALNPEDPYTLRNLGAMLANDSVLEGLPYFEKAAQLLPEDPQALYGYGKCLMDLKRYDEADSVLKKVMDLSPYSEMVERAKTARTEIARINMRNNAGGQLRIDAVMYCLAAIEKFEEWGIQKCQSITYEIAMLGQSGLDINSPDHKYTLKSMAGEFTGMQLMSYMFVGLKQINPDLNSGIDLENEYKAALGLFNQKSK